MEQRRPVNHDTAIGIQTQLVARRRRHVPERTCIACRIKASKRTLVRVVRTPEQAVIVDPSGRANGRGAYICIDPGCWERALSSKALAAALRMDPSAEERAALRAFATTLASPVEPVIDLNAKR